MIKVRLIKLLSHAKKYVWLQILFQWISLLAQILLIYCLTSLIAAFAGVLYSGAGLSSLDKSKLIYSLLVMIFCALTRSFLEWLTSRTSYRASLDVKKLLRSRIYEKLLRLGSSYREKVHTAEVVQLAGEGVEQLEIYFGKYLSQFFYSLLCPLTLFAVLSFVNIKAATILLVCVPLIPLSIVVVMKIAKRLLHKYWGLYAELGDSFLENLQGLTTLKIYRADEKHAQDMDRESQKFRRVTMKVLTMQLNSTSVMDIMAYGGAAVGMIVTLLQYRADNVNLQGALMIILLAAEFFIPLRLLGSFFHIAMNGMAASDKIFALLDLPEEEEKNAPFPQQLCQISMENLNFSYTQERQILQNINIECKKGITAFVGLSGSGKSTLASIIMQRNKGYEGTVLLAGKEAASSKASLELRQISQTSLLQNIVLVNHESYLFKGSLKENLLIAKPEASDSELEASLKKVNLFDFVQAQGGLDYQLQEAASNLSGGQKQRLALARALLRNPQAYIFDEATSNIDVESEALIMKVIEELAKDKIIILISHRLANIVNADKIYFLQKGEIIESGSHSQLMKEGGQYARLFKSQKELEGWGEAFMREAENGNE